MNLNKQFNFNIICGKGLIFSISCGTKLLKLTVKLIQTAWIFSHIVSFEILYCSSADF